jgi:hypothetical protein
MDRALSHVNNQVNLADEFFLPSFKRSAYNILIFDLDLLSILALDCVAASNSINVNDARSLAIDIRPDETSHNDTCACAQYTISRLQRKSHSSAVDEYCISMLRGIIVLNFTSASIKPRLVHQSSDFDVAELRNILRPQPKLAVTHPHVFVTQS